MNLVIFVNNVEATPTSDTVADMLESGEKVYLSDCKDYLEHIYFQLESRIESYIDELFNTRNSDSTIDSYLDSCKALLRARRTIQQKVSE